MTDPMDFLFQPRGMQNTAHIEPPGFVNLPPDEVVTKAQEFDQLTKQGGGVLDWVALLAPLIGAGAGALIDGKSGAKAGLAGGVGLSQGYINAGDRRREFARRDFIDKEKLKLRRDESESQRGAADATTRLRELQIQEQEDTAPVRAEAARLRLDELRTKLDPENQEYDRERSVALQLLNRPQALKRYIDGNEALTKEFGGLADALMVGDVGITPEFQKFIYSEIDKVDAGENLSGVAVSRILNSAERFGVQLSPDQVDAIKQDAAANDLKVALTADESKRITDAAVVIGGAGRVMDRLQDPLIRKELGPTGAIRREISRRLKGETGDSTMDAFLAEMGLTTEFFARAQTGAAISGSEESRFARQVGNDSMTADAFETSLRVLINGLQDRQRQIYEQKIRNKGGWSKLGREEQDTLLNQTDEYITQPGSIGAPEPTTGAPPDLSGYTTEELERIANAGS